MSKTRSASYLVAGAVALFYSVLVSSSVQVRAWAAAVGVFVYGLAFVLVLIYLELRQR